jgi:hypothetical protein
MCDLKTSPVTYLNHSDHGDTQVSSPVLSLNTVDRISSVVALPSMRNFMTQYCCVALLLAPLSSWITIKITCTKIDAFTSTYCIHAAWSSSKVQDFIVHSSYYGVLLSSGGGLRGSKCFSCQWTNQTKEAGHIWYGWFFETVIYCM